MYNQQAQYQQPQQYNQQVQQAPQQQLGQVPLIPQNPPIPEQKNNNLAPPSPPSEQPQQQVETNNHLLSDLLLKEIQLLDLDFVDEIIQLVNPFMGSLDDPIWEDYNFIAKTIVRLESNIVWHLGQLRRMLKISTWINDTYKARLAHHQEIARNRAHREFIDEYNLNQRKPVEPTASQYENYAMRECEREGWLDWTAYSYMLRRNADYIFESTRRIANALKKVLDREKLFV